MKKKGQVTIFVIIAILIVIAGILIYQFVPSVKTALGGVEKNPNIFMTDCMEDDFVSAIEEVSKQGGVVDPEHYYLYKDEKLRYLCFTEEEFKKCTVQEPFIKEKVEGELKQTLTAKVNSCLDSLKRDYDDSNYQTSLEKGDIEVRVLPQGTVLTVNSKFVATKDETNTYNQFTITQNNNLYQLLDIAKVIVDYESELGNIETTEIMTLYRNLKVEKIKQSDETKVYIITDKKTGDTFKFASRSLAFPIGYN